MFLKNSVMAASSLEQETQRLGKLEQPTSSTGTPVENDQSLERSLRPIYLVTYYSGILLDWCRDQYLSQSRPWCIFHYICTSIVLLILSINLVFEIIQFGLELSKTSSVHSIVPNLLWICTFPLNLMVLFRYYNTRSDFLSFFDEWRQLENQLLRRSDNASSINWLVKLMIGAYFLLGVGLIFGIYFLSQNQPDASFLLSSYPLLRDWFTLPVLSAFHAISVLISWILLSLADLVPALIYTHAGLVLNSLNIEVEHHFSVGDYATGLRKTWLRYETLSRLTDKANGLFGWIIFTDYAVKFCMICVLFYSALCNFLVNSDNLFIFYFGALSYVFRLVSCNLLASRLHYAFLRFKSTVSSLFSLNCHCMTEHEREMVSLLLGRLEQNPLGAKVLGVMEITPKMLLTMASLITSYVIVLLQSK